MKLITFIVSKIPAVIRRSYLLSILILILSMTACMVGPNYHPPETKISTEYGSQDAKTAKSVTDANQAIVSKWWTTFNDPTLDSLVDRAVKGNLDLQIAQARVREARALRGIVTADLYPTVIVGGSYQRRRISASQFGIPAEGEENQSFDSDLYQVGFDASWEIDIFGGVRRSIEAANADIAAEVENRRDTLVTLLSEVARNYIELRSAQQQIAIANNNLKVQRETLELTQIRFDAGLVSALDVARAEAQVETTASQVPLLETSARQSMHALSVLLGQEPNALDQELAVDAPIPPAPPLVPVGLPSELLRRRPDIRRAERQLAAQTARIGVATADLFPKFSLTGTLGLTSPKVGDLASSDSGTWSIIPGVSWPILDFGRIKSNIAVQNAREQQATVFYEQTILNSLQEVADALVAFSQEQTRRENLERAVEANRTAVSLSNDLYRQGLTDFLSVLQAQLSLFITEDALVRSNSTVSSSLVALYKALGGGWEIESQAVETLPLGKAGSRTVTVGAAETKPN